jgi:hypothetical protein
MTNDPALEPPLAIGFLTVLDRSPQGLVGGYLVLNERARPLEFHATAPLRSNRVQEILYGPTLRPFLYGEQIGLTLVQASELRPLAVFTDCRPVLALAPLVDVPLWLVLPPPSGTPGPEREPMARSFASEEDLPANFATLSCGANRLACSPSGARAASNRTDSAVQIDEPLAAIVGALNLSEPFERIRAAIEEAQRGAA